MTTADERESDRKRHPIQVVARRTGLTADVLRAWEKRYGVVEPGRSEGGRRLYSDADIERLRLLRRASLAGRRIGQIASLSTERLATLVQEDEREEAEVVVRPPRVAASALAEVHLQASLAALEQLDARELETVLNRAMVTLSAPVLIEQVAGPLLRRVGELWSQGGVRPAHEHLTSAVLLRVLGKVLEATEPSGAARNLVAATPAGQQHEFGALFAAATAASEGWGVTYLGRDLPAEDIAAAATETGAEVVALSIVYPTEQRRMEDELRTLRRRLPPDVPICVGGAGVSSYKRVLDEIGARHLADMEELRSFLSELH
jgi:DNA-binding transcriptional MerR regulator/methylmalonyl-CoA mutase cobalamin-binding subunit